MAGTGMPSGSWRADRRRHRLVQGALGGRLHRHGADDALDLAVGHQVADPRHELLARVALGRARERPAVDLDLRLPGDHVVLDARVHDRGAERVAQQRVEHHGIGRVARGAQRGRRPPRVVADDRRHERRLVRGQGRPDLGEQPPHDRRRPGLARDRDSRHDVGGADERVVVARHRAVTPPAAHLDAVRLVALLRDHDRVEPAATDLERDAPGLVERPGRPERLGPVLDQPARAVDAARLLVGGAREQDVAPEARDRIRGPGRGRRRPPRRASRRSTPTSSATIAFMSTAPRPQT